VPTPERGHCLADDVLAQHRPKRRTSVAAPGISDGLLMPAKKDQAPPDLRYFKQTGK
jgi:hypothetical protein